MSQPESGSMTDVKAALEQASATVARLTARIEALEDRVKASGQAACRWGVPPPLRAGKKRQFRDSAGRVSELCQQCELQYEVQP